MPPQPPPLLIPGLTVLERGWLSSNSVLVHEPDGGPAALIDSGHVTHAAQTVALVHQALVHQALAQAADSTRRGLGGALPHEDGAAPASGRAAPLGRLLNTHLHSDHCGGNAALQRAFAGLEVVIPPGGWDAVQAWDEEVLGHRPLGQRCERFTAQARIAPGETVHLGGRPWAVLAAPGHDPQAVMFFDPLHGLLVAGDALWEDGFGVVFPELLGEPGFDDVAAVLEAIDRLPVCQVVPGHGAPFTDVAGALARARRRLEGLRADPARQRRHAAKVLVKYHLMEEREQAQAALAQWAADTPFLARLFAAEGFRHATDPVDWCRRIVDQLVESGALTLRDGVVHDA